MAKGKKGMKWKDEEGERRSGKRNETNSGSEKGEEERQKEE